MGLLSAVSSRGDDFDGSREKRRSLWDSQWARNRCLSQSTGRTGRLMVEAAEGRTFMVFLGSFERRSSSDERISAILLRGRPSAVGQRDSSRSERWSHRRAASGQRPRDAPQFTQCAASGKTPSGPSSQAPTDRGAAWPSTAFYRLALRCLQHRTPSPGTVREARLLWQGTESTAPIGSLGKAHPLAQHQSTPPLAACCRPLGQDSKVPERRWCLAVV